MLAATYLLQTVPYTIPFEGFCNKDANKTDYATPIGILIEENTFMRKRWKSV